MTFQTLEELSSMTITERILDLKQQERRFNNDKSTLNSHLNGKNLRPKTTRKKVQ